MNPKTASDEAASPGLRDGDSIEKRVEALASWMRHVDLQLRATATAVDEKALRELRRTIEALAKRDPRFEDRVTNRVDVVADRLASLAKTVATTATALAAKDGEIAGLRRELREANARVDAVLAELRRTLDAARADAPTVQPSREKRWSRGDRQLGAFDEKLDVLAQRLDTLAGTVAATAAGLAGRDGELAALRRKLDDEASATAAAIAELRRSVDPLPLLELREDVKALSQETSALKRSSRRGLDEVTSRLTALSHHADSLEKAVASAVDGVSRRQSEIAGLRASFGEEDARLDAQVVELHQAIGTLTSRIEALPDRAGDPEAVAALEEGLAVVNDRLGALAAQVAALASELEVAAVERGRWDAETAALERRFEEADALAREQGAVVSEIAGAARAWSSDRASLEARLEEIGGAVASTAAALERSRDEIDLLRTSIDSLASRLDEVDSAAGSEAGDDAEKHGELAALTRRFEEASTRVDVLVGDLRTALETMPAPRHDADEEEARVDRLEESIGGLSGRLARVEAAAASSGRDDELRRAVANAASRLDAIEVRLGEAESDPPVERPETSVAERETDRLRVLVDGLASRIASAERDLLSLTSSRDATGGLDELRRRLDLLELAGHASAASEPELPLPGEGRFRLELRALELRMEHAEAAARENREAVLLQLERLASRIEWRFRELETAEAGDALQHPSGSRPLGRVVPIRGPDDV